MPLPPLMKKPLLFLCLLGALVMNTAAQPLRRAAPQRVGLDPVHLAYADTAIEAAIAHGEIPGAVLAVVRHGKMAYLKAYGNRQADGTVLCGVVHDPLARVLNGGVSGNAGLFSTADDVAIFCAALQNGGEWNGHRILSPRTVEAMCSVPREVASFGRTLGWDCFTAYASCNGDFFSPQTYSHTGFTGTSIVIDPVTDTSVILLINAVHPEEGHSVVRLRSLISNIVAASIVR